ncbi:MAG TPA: dethiobiotin synthase [Xanthobacteraceae bacterium]|nr:dethiobiotin synthase [Xanthobacteraceae bacterium]
MPGLFVTATGTEIGKTHVACALIRHLRARGQAVDALKPLVTGFEPANVEASDPGRLLAALGRPVTAEEIARIAPWRFTAPLAPDLAARREGRAVVFDELVAFSRSRLQHFQGTLLIEGIGGIMVPLDGRHTVLDWMVALRLPLLLVTGSYLGSISHTLACIDVLQRRDLPILALIVNETPGATVTMGDAIDCLSRYVGALPLLSMRQQEHDLKPEDAEKIISFFNGL